MRRTRFLIGCLVVLNLALLSSALPGQTVAAPEKPVPPYVGIVNADRVNVRCGPGLYYYPLASVSQGTRVVVAREADPWLGVRPLEGIFGLIRKSDVTLSEDGTTATVSAPRARVYAASATAKRRWCVMKILDQGETVRLPAPPEGDLLRVAPPQKSLVYIMGNFVTPSPTDVVPPEDETGAMIGVEVELPKADPLREAFKEAEAALREELKEPVGDRDYGPLIAKFTEIAESTDKAILKEAAARYLAYLETRRQQQAEYRNVVALGERLDRRLAEIEAERMEAQAESERRRAMARAPFLAEGVVAPLAILEGVDYPIKYKLVDERGRPVVVLKSETYNLADYVGKAVGVRGSKTYLPEWGTYLVAVDDMELLE